MCIEIEMVMIISEILLLLRESQADKERNPSLVICKTKLGFCSPTKKGKAIVSTVQPLGDDEHKLN